jgi:hypothetical protein
MAITTRLISIESIYNYSVRRLAVALSIGIFLQTLAVNPAIAQVENLVLKTPIPARISSGTFDVELQPKSYSADLRYDGVAVCIWDLKGYQCSKYWDLSKTPGVRTGSTGSYGTGVSISVLTINENKYIFNFETAGNFEILLIKTYTKDMPGRSGRENFESTIRIPIEISDVSYGGFDVRDLSAVGIKINPYPILKCPEKIKNVNQTISCNLSYGYEDPEYDVLYEPFERFKICAYKNAGDILDCKLKNPYLNKEIQIELNKVEKITIPIYKDVDTHIELVPIISGNFPQFMDTLGSQHYFFKPAKKTAPIKSKSNSGKRVKKCEDIVTRTDGRFEIIDGRIQGGPVTTRSEVCRNVWVP